MARAAALMKMDLREASGSINSGGVKSADSEKADEMEFDDDSEDDGGAVGFGPTAVAVMLLC